MNLRVRDMSGFLKLDIKKKQNREKRCTNRPAGRIQRLDLHTLHREGARAC
jgi:hypothetical protein